MPQQNKQFYIRFFGDTQTVANQAFQEFLNLKNEAETDENLLLRKKHFDEIAAAIGNEKFSEFNEARQKALATTNPENEAMKGHEEKIESVVPRSQKELIMYKEYEEVAKCYYHTLYDRCNDEHTSLFPFKVDRDEISQFSVMDQSTIFSTMNHSHLFSCG